MANGLTVSELIQALSEFPPLARVLISCDAEGNAYSPIERHGVVPISYSHGEVSDVNGKCPANAVALYPVD